MAASPAASGAGSGIVYVCDANLTALQPDACTTLNTTIAGLYSAAFTNANATIYVMLGNTDLGSNESIYNTFTYSQFRNALAASAADSNDLTALSSSAPPTNPYGNSLVDVNNALQRALGLGSPNSGVDPNLGICNMLTSAQCYDGVIVVSNNTPLYFREGPISAQQYDFYSVVEHETDEVLGTASCAFGGCQKGITPADLFRYHSNGTRSDSAGTNSTCATSNATNACFSIDGVHMLQQYNNVNNGDDAGDWVTNCVAQLVQDAERCPDAAGVDITLSAEILVLDVAGFTLQPFVQKGPYPCTNTAEPMILTINSASAYGDYSHFAPGSWLEIKGTNLADPADPRLPSNGGTGQWTSRDFTNTVNAPTVLDGISVTINSKPAYVWYISTGQLNVQAPADSATGGLAITVTNCKAQSAAYPVLQQTLAPGMLAPPNYSANGTQYMVATFVSDNAYVLNTSTGASLGLNSRPAKPGDQIIAYGVGFGAVTPALGPGTIEEQNNALADPVTFSFVSASSNSIVVTPTFEGLAGGFVGLYEFYIDVPTGLANGNYKITVTQNGSALPQTMYLTVQN